VFERDIADLVANALISFLGADENGGIAKNRDRIRLAWDF